MAHRTILPEKSVHLSTGAISYGVRVVDVKVHKIILREESVLTFKKRKIMAYLIFIWLFWYIFKKKKNKK